MIDIPKVSVLVPIYNVEKYIGKCLDSIFCQTYTNIEYIFADDCSVDNSLEVLKSKLLEYNIPSEKYKIINHSDNKGIAQTRIDLLAKAHGDYIQFVDSDDWIEQNMIETMVKATDKGKIDIVGCDFNRVYLDNRIIYDKQNYSINCHDNLFNCINYNIGTFLWKLLIRKNLFDIIDIDKDVNIGEDYIISIKLYHYAKSFVAIHKPLYNYVSYNINRLTFKHLQSLSDHILALGKVEDFLISNDLFDKAIRQQILLRKFNIKRHYLYKPYFYPKLYLSTFPEANGIWHNQYYTIIDKFKFWFVENIYTFFI